MALKVLFATHNPGKLVEIKSILSAPGIRVVTPEQAVAVTDQNLAQLDVEETGKTFKENALLKARVFAKQSGLLTAADDSGLEVEILDGFPGVKSARWLQGSDQDRNLALLEKMENVSNRQAKFVTVICLYDPDLDSAQYFRGEVQGEIAPKSLGEAGFGYDAIFIPQNYKKTFAQLGLEIKNKLSHRRQALEKLKDYLENKV